VINRHSAFENLPTGQAGGEAGRKSKAFTLIELPVVRPFDKLRPGKRKSSAFTLIELLVVIAIISLLVSILLPSLNRAKNLTRRVVCGSNMKQLGLAFVMYTNDWRSNFPFIREEGPSGVSGVWADKLYNDYTNGVKVFHCPSSRERAYHPNEVGGAYTMAYGMEWWVGGGKTTGPGGDWPTNKISNIAQPAKTILLGEGKNVNGNGNEAGHGYGIVDTSFWGEPDETRHSGVSNILCIDSHVASYTTEEALAPDGELVWIENGWWLD